MQSKKIEIAIYSFASPNLHIVAIPFFSDYYHLELAKPGVGKIAERGKFGDVNISVLGAQLSKKITRIL